MTGPLDVAYLVRFQRAHADTVNPLDRCPHCRHGSWHGQACPAQVRDADGIWQACPCRSSAAIQ